MEVYCVYCKNLVPKSKADSIMKTAFYRTMIPVGTCQTCKEPSTIQLSSGSAHAYLTTEAS
jgi:hypothetical protein